MTLDTRVYVLSEADPHDVFGYCRDLLGADPVRNPWSEDHDREWPVYHPRERVLRNRAGTGLDALLWSYYVPGEPLISADAHARCDECCDQPCDGRHEDRPPCWQIVHFDTAYGYRDERGWGCGTLHASLVARLGAWLDARGVMWAWLNEFSGEVHVGDRYERLMDLVIDGERAEHWFREVVVPLVPALAARYGVEGA